MHAAPDTIHAADPRHTFVGTQDLMARYGLGKTTICALVKEPDFPGQVAPRRWRLDQVLAYEERASRRALTVPEAPEGTAAGPDPTEDVLGPRRGRRAA